MDKLSGQGGEFEVLNGERRRKGDAPKAEPAGGGARDKDGKPIRDKTQALSEPAVPAPAAAAPWESPEAEKPAEKQPAKKGA